MFGGATRKAWRSATRSASTTPNRESKAYRAGRAVAQVATGRKPTKYKDRPEANPLEGKQNVANITSYKDGRRYDYAYDNETGDVYDLKYDLQHDPATSKWHGRTGGMKVTNLMNVKEYQPVSFGTQNDRPGQIPGRGMKGRRYTGVDAVVKALRDEGGDVFILDKTPGKGKQASTTGRVPSWRSPMQPVGEYVDPRKRHEIPASSNPAKNVHNMFWRQAAPISEQEKRARETLANSRAQHIIDLQRGNIGPPKPPPSTGAGPAGSPTGPQSGPGSGGSHTSPYLSKSHWWRTRGRTGQGPTQSGSTPGPAPSQNQAVKPQSSTGLGEVGDIGKAMAGNYYSGYFDQISGKSNSKAFNIERSYKDVETAYGRGEIKTADDLKAYLSTWKPAASQKNQPPVKPDIPPGADHLPMVHETTDVPERKTPGQWRRTPGNKPAHTPFSPFDDAESDMFREQFGKFPPAGKNWYVVDPAEGKTLYGTGPKTRKLRPGEAKTAQRQARPAAEPDSPLPPAPEATPDETITPGTPLALNAPAQAAKAWRKKAKPKAEVALPPTQADRGAILQAENALQNEFHQADMARMAASGKNKPRAYNENVARNIITAHQGDHFGTQAAFENEDLIDQNGRQLVGEGSDLHPTVKALAGATDDIGMARLGIVPKNVENPFEYSTKSGPDTMPFGTEGDMQIAGRLGIAERTIQEIEAERATNPQLSDKDYDRAITQVLIDQAGPAKVLGQQRDFLAAADEARARGDNKLADRIESFSGEIAQESFRRSPKTMDAFSTYREDSDTLTRGTYLSSPQQDESKINALTRPEIKALESKLASGQQLTFDEEYLLTKQKEIDATNLQFSAATGQGGSNPANTKMFNTVALPSPVPWAKDEKAVLGQVPPTQMAEVNADAQFSRELDRPEVGNSRFDYEFEPQRFEPRQDMPLEDQLAEALAGRFGSVSRNLASLGFGANAVDAAGNRQMLQGQDGEEGYSPQGAAKHWSSLGTVEMQLGAIQGGGKVPGMEEVTAATYAATFPEYQAKARDFLASLPPDIPDEQFQAAAQEFIRGEFNQRLAADYARHTNPESDTTGGHNIFRMPNTKSMIQDDPSKATLQQVADGAIPEIVTPQTGDPYGAWNARLQNEEADQNVRRAYEMVDQGVYEKANDFWSDPLKTPGADVALAAERFLNDGRSRPQQRVAQAGSAQDAADAGYSEKGAAKISSGLRRGATVDKGWRSGQPKPDAFRNPEERMLEHMNQTSFKQSTRQDKYLFDAPGARKSQNLERIEADQLAMDDVVNLHVPGKGGGKLEQARVVDIVDGQVVLEDGEAFGRIILDPADESRSAINVHSIEQHPDPMVDAERRLAEILGGKFQAQAESPPIVPETAGQPEIQSATGTSEFVPETPKRARKGSKTPGLEPAAFDALYGTPFQQIVQGEVPKILSPNAAAMKAKAQGLNYASGYDSAGDFGPFWNSKIFSKTGSTPDEVHAHMVARGSLPEDSTVDDMFAHIYRGIDNYQSQVEQVKAGKIQVQQAERVQKEVFSPKSAKRNPVAIKGSDLIVGQQVEIAVPNAAGRKNQTEIAEVVGIDEDGNAMLEDGPRYGPFQVGENDTIYGKRILEGNVQPDDPWTNPEPFDIQQTAAPNAFTLKQDVPNMNFDTNQGLLLDVDESEVDRMLREEQRRKNKKRLQGQSDFFGGVPF